MQDQAFLGPEAALAMPDSDGGGRRALHLDAVAARGPRARSPSASGCPRSACGCTLGGVGGAFGAREDVSLQVHVCLLALRTGRPVKMMYGREESFLGHVHRHPGAHLDAAPRRAPTARS